jgi:Flp pilus assembly protein TadB
MTERLIIAYLLMGAVLIVAAVFTIRWRAARRAYRRRQRGFDKTPKRDG